MMDLNRVDYIEINMCNYSEDDVAQLNQWGMEAVSEIKRLKTINAELLVVCKLANSSAMNHAAENERLKTINAELLVAVKELLWYVQLHGLETPRKIAEAAIANAQQQGE